MIKALGVSEGIGIGKAYVKKEVSTASYTPAATQTEELDRLTLALEDAAKQINAVRLKALEDMGEGKAQIFEAHLMMLQDPEYTDTIRSAIEDHGHGVNAVEGVTESFASMFESMDNAYMQERAIDMRDIGRRIVLCLLGAKPFDPTTLENAVLIARDLTPSDTALLDPTRIEAIITEIGGDTSHSAIIAKALGIPAVMGVKNATTLLAQDATLVVDGKAGIIIDTPDADTLLLYRTKKTDFLAYRETLKVYVDQPTLTKDGRHLEVSANIARPEEAQKAFDFGAEGIGLFRSEFIFMDRASAPSENEQYECYKRSLELMQGRPVIIRTMDIGGDKAVDYLQMEKEENPFLGYRAVRYCLDHEEFFLTQLRALLRAGVHGRLRIMVPMISKVSEIRRVKELVEMAKEQLTAAKLAYTNDYELGIMIEVPSAALMSDVMAKEVDFFSIGTNDLTQYTMAADRMNSCLSDIYDPMDPAVLRLINMTITNGHEAGIWVGMCGSAAGNALMAPVLLGMGLDEFSVSPNAVPELRKLLCSLDSTSLTQLTKEVLMSDSPQTTKALVEAFLNA